MTSAASTRQLWGGVEEVVPATYQISTKQCHLFYSRFPIAIAQFAKQLSYLLGLLVPILSFALPPPATLG